MLNLYETIVSYGHGSLDASYLCVHETANPGATAYDHLNYWSRDDRYAVHYVVDWNQRVYHCVPDDRKCWQVGYGNPYVIGIELCHATNQEDFDKVWEVAVEWAVYMLDKYGWGIDRLLCHDDCRRMWGGTDHTDPIEYFDSYGRSWEEFLEAVESKMNEEEIDVITDEDRTAIAMEVAKTLPNYVWGYEKDGQSVINKLYGLGYSTALETLGYTNKRMNGDNDVYQILTDLKDDVAALKREVAALNEKIL